MDYDAVTEYHLRSLTGRTVCTFDSLERARQEAAQRNLRLFKITRIEEEIA